MNFLIRRTFRNHFVPFTIVYASARAKNEYLGIFILDPRQGNLLTPSNVRNNFSISNETFLSSVGNSHFGT